MQPLTYLFDFEHIDEKCRPYIMQEFAVNGATNLVLTDTLIKEVMKDSGLYFRLQKELQDTGTQFVDSHAPFGTWEDLDNPIAEMHRTLIERKKLAMIIAADFGVDTITIHVGNAPLSIINQGYTIEQCDDAIKSSLEELLPLAEELNQVICIENIWCPTNTTDKLKYLIDYFKSDYLGICYDAGHANLMKCDRGTERSAPIDNFTKARGMAVPYDDKILETLLPHIVNCHLHDNNGIDDEHKIFGDGNVDWPHVIGLLKTAPRIRSFQSEVIPVHSMASIREIVEKFSALFA